MIKNITIKKDQRFMLPVLWTGQESELTYNINLAGNNANLKLFILLLGKKNDKVNLVTNIYHKEQNTTSKIIVKGAFNESSQVDFNGLVKIEPGAKGTNAWLGPNFLLLSENSRGRAVPSLEILENDIKAGHATTVGRLNDTELFYLMSRGLSLETAKKLIIEGFINSMLSDFPEKLVKRAKKELEYLQ